MTEIKRIKEVYSTNHNIHQTAQKTNHSWSTVKSYINKGPDEIKKMGKREKTSRIGNEFVVAKIREYLQWEEEVKVPKKQRMQAAVMYRKFKDEDIFQGSERYFRKIFANVKNQLKIRKDCKSFLELKFNLGEYLQIDHGPVTVEYKGNRLDAFLFVASVPNYSIRFCQLYFHKSSESWGDFHEQAFKFFGGVFPNCIYDNDSVLKTTANSYQTAFALELERHYKFKSIYCNLAAGWEKGAVEKGVSYCRRNFLTGIPKVEDLAELNESLRESCQKHIKSSYHYQTKQPLKDYFNQLKDKLLPLPQSYEWGVWHKFRVDSLQYVKFNKIPYSVPEKFIGFDTKCFVTPFYFKIYCDGELIALHKRAFMQGESRLELSHFLEQLSKKPKAIAYARVMQEQQFPEYILEIKKRLHRKYESVKADTEFIKILKLKYTCTAEEFETGICLGLSYGGITSTAIECFIKQLQLSQEKACCPTNLLPAKCQDNFDKDFNLDNYHQLYTREE